MDISILEKKISEYMLLQDKGITKLLLSFIIGCRLPLPPPWIFIVSSSSGGKTKLIQLLEKVPGYLDVDDLTANTLLSGAKSHTGSTSLLHRVTTNGFLVFRDFTTILSKNKEVMGQLMGQLRMVYDGKFIKHTGLGEEIAFKPKKAPGLLAGVTTKIHTTSQEWSDMGERMVMYHMEQPDNREMGKWIMNSNANEKEQEAELQALFQSITAGVTIPQELPELDPETKTDLIEIAYLTVSSRSAVERTQAGFRKRIDLKHDQEMIGRFLKQLKTLAYGMAILNGDNKLTDLDRTILYKIGLDSIPMQRFMVMKALTGHVYGGDINQIADFLKYPHDTVEEWVEDLVALGILNKQVLFAGQGTKKTYSIEPKYSEIMSKFEGITPQEEALPESEESKITSGLY